MMIPGSKGRFSPDGAYSGEEKQALAKEKNIDLVTTDLTGRKAPDIIMII